MAADREAAGREAAWETAGREEAGREAWEAAAGRGAWEASWRRRNHLLAASCVYKECARVVCVCCGTSPSAAPSTALWSTA